MSKIALVGTAAAPPIAKPRMFVIWKLDLLMTDIYLPVAGEKPTPNPAAGRRPAAARASVPTAGKAGTTRPGMNASNRGAGVHPDVIRSIRPRVKPDKP